MSLNFCLPVTFQALKVKPKQSNINLYSYIVKTLCLFIIVLLQILKKALLNTITIFVLLKSAMLADDLFKSFFILIAFAFSL